MDTSNVDDQDDKPSQTSVKSTAVVKYSAVLSPAPFCELNKVNLNFPPENWLRESDWHCQLLKRRTASVEPVLASLHMATEFHDCVGDVDVMSNAENIKKLLKMPYSKSQVSMMVHRIGKTLFLDEFDINTYLLRAAKKEWDWLKKFYLEHVLQSLKLQQKEMSFVRKNRSRDYLQHKSMLSKFLYYSVANKSSEEEDVTTTRSCPTPKQSKQDRQQDDFPSDDRFSSPASGQNEDDMFHSFQRNVLWTFDDITMLIGTDLPIFGAGSHPCVSLRLRDIAKPINILTGLDYWLDNLMCNVPEVMMCYHLDGIVQKYELIKTEDLPKQENSNFSPKVIKDVAQNVLSFLKSNATKAGHTYWLFKEKNGEVVKLYDLTVLCPEGMQDEERNPVTTPLAMLLYRLARNMKAAGPKKSQIGTIAMLLQNCLALLDATKHPQIVTSSHYMLSDMYVPDIADLSSPTISGITCDGDDDDEDDDDDFDDDDDDDGDDEEVCSTGGGSSADGGMASSVDIKTLCLPGRLESRRPSKNATCLLSGSLKDRCLAALQHSQDGMACLEVAADHPEQKAHETEVHSSGVQGRATPYDPIPLHYEPINKPSPTDMRIAPNAPFRSHWKITYAKLLLNKAAIAAYVLAHGLSDSCTLGTALRYTKLSFLCYDAMEQLSCGEPRTERSTLEPYLLRLAGDLHFLLIQQGTRMGEFGEQFEAFDSFAGLTRTAKRIINRECRFKWAVKLSTNIEENLKRSARCYECALDTVGGEDDRNILRKRLGNINNEMGVFHLNRAQSLFNEKTELTPEVESLLRRSHDCFDSGAKFFEGIDDDVNATLLYSNLGRLMRTQAFCYANSSDGPKEFTSKERSFYEKAITYYQKSLRILNDEQKQSSNIRESVSWELSTTLFTMALFLQDYPPLSDRSREEIEKEITELMMKALKCIDLDTQSARQPIHQYRAATIHHRLGTLYHHSNRHSSDENRKKQLRTLADINFNKSTKLFLQLEDVTEFLQVQLERIGMWEVHAQSLTGPAAKIRCFQRLLELVFETLPILEIAALRTDDAVRDLKVTNKQKPSEQSEAEQELDETSMNRPKLLALLQTRLQAALLSLAKSSSAKSTPTRPANKGSSPEQSQSLSLLSYKRMYNISLQLPTPVEVQKLIDAITKIATLYRELPDKC